MHPDFIQLLQSTRARASEMNAIASSGVGKDSKFWHDAADLSDRWSRALSTDSLDWNALGALREEAKTKRVRAGVWLFAFCNDLEESYRSLRAASFLNEEEARDEEYRNAAI